MNFPLHSWCSRLQHPRRPVTACSIKLLGSCAALALAAWYLLPFAFPTPVPPHIPPSHHASTYPTLLVQATLAAEDKRFFSHAGVDLCANFRAVKDAIQAKRFVSGASTITQQTVKLLNDTPPRTLETKCIEALSARHLEMAYDKHTILHTYFSLLDYGNQNLGPSAAARHYFDKHLDALTLPEAALLAGLPQAPSRHDPRRNPDNALKRRNWVLQRMHVVYDLPLEQITQAQAQPLGLVDRSRRSKLRRIALSIR